MDRIPLSVMALLLSLTACAPGRIDHIYIGSRYQPHTMSFIPYNRSIGVDVSGTAFDMPKEDFDRLVNEAVQAPGFEPNRTSEPHVRMLFNNGVGTPAQGACMASGSDAPKGKMAGDVGVTAILCEGNETVTYLVASLADSKGPQDEEFRKFLRYITVRLFPNVNDQDRDNCIVPGC